MATPTKCIRYNEDEMNPGAGAGICFDTHAGFGKDCLKCEEVIRTGRCRYGRKTPYLKGGRA
jgi:hypothetical protein